MLFLPAQHPSGRSILLFLLVETPQFPSETPSASTLNPWTLGVWGTHDGHLVDAIVTPVIGLGTGMSAGPDH